MISLPSKMTEIVIKICQPAASPCPASIKALMLSTAYCKVSALTWAVNEPIKVKIRVAITNIR